MTCSRLKKYLVGALLVLAVARFAVAFEAGTRFYRGDFYASLPGAYAETVNPALWNSPDLENIQSRSAAYLRGPTQYLTLYPLVYLDTYQAIARVLLVVYALAIVLIAVLMHRLLRDVHGEPVAWAPVVISTLLFFPLLQAWMAREFEVLIVLAFTLALLAVVRQRLALLGGLLAYVTLYKYLPLVAVPYLIARRWWASLAGFVAVGGAMLALAHWLFGLEGFVNNHIPGMATGQLTSLASTNAFCDGLVPLLRYTETGQGVSVRIALCGLSRVVPFSPPVAFIVLALLTAGLSIYGFVRLERAGPLPVRSERWRRVWELSVIVLVVSTFFYAHYYYLAALILPVNALLVFLTRGPVWPWRQLSLWARAYWLLAGFLVPPSFASRLLGIDLWRLYFLSLAVLPGTLILLGLVLWQYLTIPLQEERSQG